MENKPIILKDKYDVSKSDLVEEIWLPKGVKGTYYNKGCDVYFNHVKFNGMLITDPNIINDIL